jgi:hypothetical protein
MPGHFIFVTEQELSSYCTHITEDRLLSFNMSLNLPSEIRSFQATMSHPLMRTKEIHGKKHSRRRGCDVPMVEKTGEIHDVESLVDSHIQSKLGSASFVVGLG